MLDDRQHDIECVGDVVVGEELHEFGYLVEQLLEVFGVGECGAGVGCADHDQFAHCQLVAQFDFVGPFGQRLVDQVVAGMGYDVDDDIEFWWYLCGELFGIVGWCHCYCVVVEREHVVVVVVAQFFYQIVWDLVEFGV